MRIREKFFNWTSKDVADWEKIREKGLLRFIWIYGVVLFSGGMFVLMSVIASIHTIIQMRPVYVLLPELGITALICLLGGLVASLATWWMEEKLYQKFKKIHDGDHQ